MIEEEQKLVKRIKQNLDTGKVVETTLVTDDRVLARITDGIYRQPASALRELIANAYDADATNVYVETDWPKFSRISVRDDGNGMSIEALAGLINHIGGSSKRTKAGADKGVVSEKDPSLSPGGRRLIGKIGIGLFSVAQLTRHFQIITKARGESHRLVAEVTLNTYSEEELAELEKQDQVPKETGPVRIQAFPAKNKNEHGTEIILLKWSSPRKTDTKLRVIRVVTLRTQPVTGSPRSSASAHGCRRSRCTRRCSPALVRGWRSPRGEPTPFSAWRRNSPSARCPSSCHVGSCCR